MLADDRARTERLLAWRRGEEELARRHEAAARRAVEGAEHGLRALRAQVRVCRESQAGRRTAGEALIDAHHCATRLSARVERQRIELANARVTLNQARERLAEAARGRLVVERMAAALAVRLRESERAAAQADTDESGRLRVLLEGE